MHLRIQALSLLVAVAAPLAFAQQPATPAPTPTPKTYQLIPGLDKSIMDTSVDPCTDFYKYACGNWAKQYPIPADSPWSGQGYNLDQYNRQVLHIILDKAAAANAPEGSNTQKVGDFYATCLDEAATDAKGLAPYQPELERIAALKSKDDLAPLLAYYQLIGVNAFISFGKQQDFQDASHNIAYISQGGLDLERDYFLRTGAKDIEIRQQFEKHIANTLKLIGESDAQAAADAAAIVKLETALAKVSLDVTTLRDPKQVYQWMPVGDLTKLTPSINWTAFLAATGAPAITHLNIGQPDFMVGLNTILTHTDLATVQAYLRWELINSLSGTLSPKALDEEHFDFDGRKLAGIQQQEPRWKRCSAVVDRSVGEALGQSYVEMQFPPSSKASTLDMVKSIEVSMDKDIDTLDWMAPATKVQAKEKLHLVANKIGYPNKWRDYSKLKVVRGDAFGNALRAREFEARRQIAEINQPVNRDEWDMTPSTVNAYYDPSMNDINFPAGILQSPYYSPDQGDALNFGSIGAVMGHELTHGFDDEGRQFDGHGNLRDWWTKEDAAKFQEKADCFVNEYSQFQAAPDTKVNGKLTLGENSADNGGLRLAYMSFLARAAAAQQDINAKTDAGYTLDQQFFVGYAQSWCSVWSPELERLVATTDPHAPDHFRVIGVLSNSPEFAKAFSCKAGSKMIATKVCRVW